MKRQGFSLIEMVIVLFVVGIFFSFSIPASFVGYREWQHRRFWHEMRQEWQLSQVRAQQQHQRTDISYDQVEREIIFQVHNHRDRISVPGNLKIQDSYECRMLPSGYVKPGTWVFMDQQHHQKIRMIIQMAGGGYRLEKVRINTV